MSGAPRLFSTDEAEVAGSLMGLFLGTDVMLFYPRLRLLPPDAGKYANIPILILPALVRDFNHPLCSNNWIKLPAVFQQAHLPPLLRT